MYSLNKFLIFIICFNILFCFITLEEKSNVFSKESSKKSLSFQEFDEIMSNTEFSKAWEKFRYIMKNGGSEAIFDQPFEDIDINDEKYETNFSDIDDQTDECLLSKEETTNILSKQFGIVDNDPADDVRFIFGKCNPVILIPGMLSTKLQVKIKCREIYLHEQHIFKKIRFYCGTNICTDEKDDLEEHNLFISAFGFFQLIDVEDNNKYAACVGYFLTFFNSQKTCSSYDEEKDDYVCNFSENIQIGYYGSNSMSHRKAKCGLNAIQNVVMVPEIMEKSVNQGMLRSMGPLIDRLEKKGYRAGFSLAAIPNDYRYFLAKNKFTMSAFRYQVEKLYENTGKNVVLIGHSFGTNTIYHNLIQKSNKDILPKIKKFIAVGPPFAGSSQLIDVFFKNGSRYQTTINISNVELNAGFDEFGFGFIINKLPTAFELRPLPIIGDLFTKTGYEIFSEAIKERFFLEKKCGHTECDDYIIKKYSNKFNALFGDYFPLLTDEDCKFEKDLKETNDYFGRKCLMEMRNVVDCPMVIEETRGEDGKLPNDFDLYCGRNDPNLFYQKDCDYSDKQCLDQVYSKHVLYPFKESNEKLQWFKKRWEEKKFNENFGDIDSSYIESEEKYMATPQKQIDFYEKISSTKDMPIPPVDTDIVYSTYNPSIAAFIFDKENWSKDFVSISKGGDGVVPNWSPLIPGLKWIFDTKKYNLPTKIKLVEFCSRLGTNSKYAFDPSKTDQKFIALSCNCINSKNLYTSKNCNHALMIGDPFFFSYIDSIINDPNIENEITHEKIEAYNKFNKSLDYEEQCNSEFLNILDMSMENKTSDDA